MDSFLLTSTSSCSIKAQKRRTQPAMRHPWPRAWSITHIAAEGESVASNILHGYPSFTRNHTMKGLLQESSSCTTTKLSKLITGCLQLVKCYCTAYCKTTRERTGVNCLWIMNNSLNVLNTLEEKQLSLTKMSTWDFSTLYTSLATTCQT